MNIRIRYMSPKPGDNDLLLAVARTTTIDRIKGLIQHAWGLNAKRLKLYYQGKSLYGACRVHDYGIRINDVVQLVVVAKSRTPGASRSNFSASTSTSPASGNSTESDRYKSSASCVSADSGSVGIPAVDTHVSENGAASTGNGSDCNQSRSDMLLEISANSQNDMPVPDTAAENASPTNERNVSDSKTLSCSPRSISTNGPAGYPTSPSNSIADSGSIVDMQELENEAASTGNGSECGLSLSELKLEIAANLQKYMHAPNNTAAENTSPTNERNVSDSKTLSCSPRSISTNGPAGYPTSPSNSIADSGSIDDMDVPDNTAAENTSPINERNVGDSKTLSSSPRSISTNGPAGYPTSPSNSSAGSEEEKDDMCDDCCYNDITCNTCGCQVCTLKLREDKIILCDDCNKGYHVWCLTPALTEVPADPERWYCPSCITNVHEIVQDEQPPAVPVRKAGRPAHKRRNSSWGKGMACVGKTKECTIVPMDHFGPIPDVEVGTTWKYRIQVSEAGVHRPPVAGIHGRETDGAYSLVLSDGYAENEDHGERIVYVGSGGRDYAGNRRVSEQSSNQSLTRMNLALSKNCYATYNQLSGGYSDDWKKGKPVRVVRNYKLGKFSKYAPKEGNRYDGIYKVVLYYQEQGRSGFLVWKFVLERDDLAFPPWHEFAPTYPIIYPPGYKEAMLAQGRPITSVERKSRKPKAETVTTRRSSSRFPDPLAAEIASYQAQSDLLMRGVAIPTPKPRCETVTSQRRSKVRKSVTRKKKSKLYDWPPIKEKEPIDETPNQIKLIQLAEQMSASIKPTILTHITDGKVTKNLIRDPKPSTRSSRRSTSKTDGKVSENWEPQPSTSSSGRFTRNTDRKVTQNWEPQPSTSSSGRFTRNTDGKVTQNWEPQPSTSSSGSLTRKTETQNWEPQPSTSSSGITIRKTDGKVSENWEPQPSTSSSRRSTRKTDGKVSEKWEPQPSTSSSRRSTRKTDGKVSENWEPQPSTSSYNPEKEPVAPPPFEIEINTLVNISRDHLNQTKWKTCTSFLGHGKQIFLERVTEQFLCPSCYDLVCKPVTTECSHNHCQKCIKMAFESGYYQCPVCRFEIGSDTRLAPNWDLAYILENMFPGYTKGRE